MIEYESILQNIPIFCNKLNIVIEHHPYIIWGFWKSCLYFYIRLGFDAFVNKPKKTIYDYIIYFASKLLKFSFLNSSTFLFFLFLAALGLHCCTRVFSSCGKWGLLFVVVRGLLIAMAWARAWALGIWASVVAACGLSSCGSRALERRLSSCGTQV